MRPGLVDYDENISHLLARKQHMATLFFAKIWPFKFNKIYQIAYFAKIGSIFWQALN